MFLRRIPTESTWFEFNPGEGDGTTIIDVEGPLPGYPPVTIEAIDELPNP